MLHFQKPITSEIKFPNLKNLKLFFVGEKKSLMILGDKNVNNRNLLKYFVIIMAHACSEINEENDLTLINEIRLTIGS